MWRFPVSACRILSRRTALGAVLALGLAADAGPFPPGAVVDFAAPRSFRAAAFPGPVVVGDFNDDHRPDIAATNTGLHSVSVLLNLGRGELSDRVVSAAGDAPIAAAAADFNHDGHLDLAVADQGTSQAVILLGDGTGAFSPGGTLPLASKPQDIQVADFNGDHDSDLLVRSGAYVSVFLGNGAGGFGARIDAVATNDTFSAAAAGDLDEDGLDDLIVSPSGGANYRLGRSDGTFGPLQSFPLSGAATSIRVLDLNADHHPDLVFTTSNNDLRVYLGQGGGVFGPVRIVPAGQTPIAIAAGDFDEDGRLDLAVGRRGEIDSLAIFRGDGQGGLAPAGSYRAGLESCNPAALDIDGDGHLDVALPLPFGGNVVVLRGDGTGRLGPVAPTVGTTGAGVVVADFDSDGHPDLADISSARATVEILRGAGAGAFAPPIEFAAGGVPEEIQAADVDGDGRPDLALLLRGDVVSILLNDGVGGFQAPRTRFGNGSDLGLVTADLDHDGAVDIVLSDRSDDAILVLRGDGAGGFDSPRLVPVDGQPTNSAVADFDEDGHPDLALEVQEFQIINGVSQRVGEHMRVLLGDGAGGFGGSVDLPHDTDFRGLVAARDLDGDSHADLLVASQAAQASGQTALAMIPGDGAGGFGAPRTLFAGSGPFPVAFADFDRDGHLDFAIASVSSADVSIFLSDGLGGFFPEKAFAAGARPVALATGDLDGDGAADLAVGDERLGLVLLLNRSAAGRPPVANAGADIVAECASADGARVTLDGSASTDPDSSPGTLDDIVSFEWLENAGQPSERSLGVGEIVQATLALGTHVVTLRVTDREGNQDTDALNVTVADTTPPRLAVVPAPAVLWPPNHRMVQVQVAADATDACGPVSVVLVGVGSSEPDDATGQGDGQTVDDVQDTQPGTADFQVALRAERSATGGGRTYMLTYRAQDASGNSATATATVVVPRTFSLSEEPLLIRADSVAGAATIAWDPVPGALAYDVIRGRLENLRATDATIDLGPVLYLDRALSPDRLVGGPDPVDPDPGRGFFYLVEYDDGLSSSFGTASTTKPRVPGPPL